MSFETCKNTLPLPLRSTFGRGLLLVLIIIAAAVSSVKAQSCDGIPDIECQALYALYNSTGGDGWIDNTNWLSTTVPVDDWHGITVYVGHVGSIVLRYNSLYGVIPPELGNLSSLSSLYLDDNNLTGEIPPELGNIPNLHDLYLAENNLTGEIPPELGNLSWLYKLNLSGNNLTGEIPPELGNSGLTELFLYGNNLTGPIPPELGNLSWLYKVDLGCNSLTGPIPPELGNPPYLTWLHLSSNNLTGPIPPELGSLANLERLSLHSNDLSGSIPPELANMTSLQSLHLYANNLSGDLPAFLATPPYNVDLKWNCLHASDPTILAAMEGKHSNQFMSTQTVPPENVTAETVESSGTEENRVLVSWDPISYVDDDGGYQVLYQKGAQPGYYYYGMAEGKDASSLTVSNLEPGVDYTFHVNTVTWAHADNNNDLQSLGSDTASAVSGTLSRAFIPVWKQSPGYFTGVVVSNFGNTDFDLNLAAYAETGALEPPGAESCQGNSQSRTAEEQAGLGVFQWEW